MGMQLKLKGSFMFKIFKPKDEFSDVLLKQCPSCHGFIKSRESKCKHCGKSTQKEPVKPSDFEESKERYNFEAEKFKI